MDREVESVKDIELGPQHVSEAKQCVTPLNGSL